MAGKKIRISETSCGRSARVRRTPFAIPETKPPIAVREKAARKSGTPKADSSRGRSCQDAQQEAEIGAGGKGEKECSRFRKKGGKPKKTGNLAADALSAKTHQSVRNADQDNNSGVEAAHFTEGSAEGAARAGSRFQYGRKLRQYKKLERLEKKQIKMPWIPSLRNA